jgi:uncharacterized membrane-anchored protein YitT (DUF2179 family)
MSDTKKIHWNEVFNLTSLVYAIIGAGCCTLALKGFMIPNHFLDGGVIGFSILAHEIFHVNIGLLLLFLNIPFLVIGYRTMGGTFVSQAVLSIFILILFIQFIEIPIVTNDKILIAVFGGLLMGLGIGLIIKGGGIVDGFEIVAHYTNKKFGFSISEIVLVTNTLLFLLAAMYFGIEPAMYSILTYFTAVKTSDYVVDGFEEFTALTIISKEHEGVKSIIVNDFKKAISVYKGERGYLPNSFDVKNDCDIIMTIVTRLEVHRIKEAISELDPTAFFYLQRIKEVNGGVVKKTKSH